MKSLTLALTLVICATLLNLVEAATNASIQVVVTYEGFEKRKVSDLQTIACVTAKGSTDVDKVENGLRFMASGKNDMKKKVRLYKGGIILYKKSRDMFSFCKFVIPDGNNGSMDTPKFYVIQSPRYAFYAKKAADKSLVTIKATAAEVLAAIAALDESCIKLAEDFIMVQITKTNEIYAGPLSA